MINRGKEGEPLSPAARVASVVNQALSERAKNERLTFQQSSQLRGELTGLILRMGRKYGFRWLDVPREIEIYELEGIGETEEEPAHPHIFALSEITRRFKESIVTGQLALKVADEMPRRIFDRSLNMLETNLDSTEQVIAQRVSTRNKANTTALASMRGQVYRHVERKTHHNTT